jgi:hypothetical protein
VVEAQTASRLKSLLNTVAGWAVRSCSLLMKAYAKPADGDSPGGPGNQGQLSAVELLGRVRSQLKVSAPRLCCCLFGDAVLLGWESVKITTPPDLLVMKADAKATTNCCGYRPTRVAVMPPLQDGRPGLPPASSFQGRSTSGPSSSWPTHPCNLEHITHQETPLCALCRPRCLACWVMCGGCWWPGVRPVASTGRKSCCSRSGPSSPHAWRCARVCRAGSNTSSSGAGLHCGNAWQVAFAGLASLAPAFGPDCVLHVEHQRCQTHS